MSLLIVVVPEMAAYAVVLPGSGVGDELGEKSGKKELRAECHQQDAKCEERAMPDRVPEEPLHREVCVDGCAQAKCPEAKPAEEVEWPRTILGEEQHGQQIEQSSCEPRWAIFGTAIAARAMSNG